MLPDIEWEKPSEEPCWGLATCTIDFHFLLEKVGTT